MTFGLTETGLVRKLHTDISKEVQEFHRAKISPLLSYDDKSVVAAISEPHVEQLAEVWELLEALYHALDPDSAQGRLLEHICALTGVRRLGATKGSVVCTCTFDQYVSIPAGGLVANVAGQSTNRWVSVESVFGNAGNYNVRFISETAGSQAVALAGTLTSIAEAVPGWTAVTNASAATAGTDVEEYEHLRQRREISLSASGSARLAALIADVQAVAGVISVTGNENPNEVSVQGIPAHGVRIVVWDGVGGAATDQAIGQALYNSMAAGTPTAGAVEVEVVKPNNFIDTVRFDRATVVPVYVDISVAALGGTSGVSATTVKNALISAHGETFGKDVRPAKLIQAALGVPNVVDVAYCEVGLSADSTSQTNIVIGWDQIALLDTSRINVYIGTATE